MGDDVKCYDGGVLSYDDGQVFCDVLSFDDVQVTFGGGELSYDDGPDDDELFCDGVLSFGGEQVTCDDVLSYDVQVCVVWFSYDVLSSCDEQVNDDV